jgi:ribose-phosphate pyrophosphokinase
LVLATIENARCESRRHWLYPTLKYRFINFPDGESRNGRHVILIDDIASSGGTLMSDARACLASGAAQVDAIVVHALFGDEVSRKLHDSGIAHVWSTDSVVHPSNSISLAPLIASSLKAV